MTATYRIQFPGQFNLAWKALLIETIVARSVDAAIRHAAEVEWPPGATALRLSRFGRPGGLRADRVDRS